jgi:hypothetical protein
MPELMLEMLDYVPGLMYPTVPGNAEDVAHCAEASVMWTLSILAAPKSRASHSPAVQEKVRRLDIAVHMMQQRGSRTQCAGTPARAPRRTRAAAPGPSTAARRALCPCITASRSPFVHVLQDGGLDLLPDSTRAGFLRQIAVCHSEDQCQHSSSLGYLGPVSFTSKKIRIIIFTVIHM